MNTSGYWRLGASSTMSDTCGRFLAHLQCAMIVASGSRRCTSGYLLVAPPAQMCEKAQKVWVNSELEQISRDNSITCAVENRFFHTFVAAPDFELGRSREAFGLREEAYVYSASAVSDRAPAGRNDRIRRCR